MKSFNGAAVVAAWGALAAGGAVHAQTTWTVCQDGSCDFTDIQSAIDASVSGDVILISSGTFVPPNTLSNTGKSIHLRGEVDSSGQPITILDGNDSRQILALSGPAASVENIVFQHGHANAGGALTIGNGCAPLIRNCVFRHNFATQFGGGVHTYQATPTFEGCTFTDNTALTNGGGLYPVGSNSTFISCRISGNVAPNGSGMFLAGNCVCHTDLISTIVCNNTNTSTSTSQVFPAGNNTWTADADSCVEADCNACIPIQWPVDEGGNGHWYRYLNEPRYWTDWNNVAMQMGGHLATLTTDDEASFISTAFPSSLRFCLGGYQDLKAPTYSEPAGGWRWVTEEPWSFESWTPGEPNNAAGGFEHYLERVNGAWNDIPNTVGRHALIEWSADCNGDGIVDYGQILDGTFADTNGNGVPDCCDEGVLCSPCPADVNEDGVVNGADISAVLGFWGQAGKPLPAADITQDGIVNGADIAVLLGNWGPCQ